ncbi:MAG: DUF3375 family protein [Candidatus Gracilibacteria bacterium]|nr:DUF3375 family protein [Candidatus Gracilibacteria bacterium]
MNKKIFIVSKLREIFNEEYIEQRQRGIKIIKNIKKYIWEDIEKIDYKGEFIDFKDGFDIDLFLGKNIWEPRIELKLQEYKNIKIPKSNTNLDEIFRNAGVSENKLISNINELLKNKKQVELKEVIEKNKVKFGLDEFVTYLKIALDGKGEIEKNRKKFEIKGLEYKISVESGNVVYKK